MRTIARFMDARNTAEGKFLSVDYCGPIATAFHA